MRSFFRCVLALHKTSWRISPTSVTFFMGSLPNGVGRYAHACERKLSRKKNRKENDARMPSWKRVRASWREASSFTGECINARFPSRLQVPLCARCAPITQKWHHVNLLCPPSPLLPPVARFPSFFLLKGKASPRCCLIIARAGNRAREGESTGCSDRKRKRKRERGGEGGKQRNGGMQLRFVSRLRLSSECIHLPRIVETMALWFAGNYRRLHKSLTVSAVNNRAHESRALLFSRK